VNKNKQINETKPHEFKSCNFVTLRKNKMLMDKLTTGEMQRLSVEEFKNARKLPVVVVLDNIRSQHNIGSVFRTADAFRIERIYLCGITATPPNREIFKTALGATESVDWLYESQTLTAIESLRRNGYQIVGVEQTTESQMIDHFTANPHQKYALIFGNEVNGIDEALLPHMDFSIEIPQAGTKHSLNVSVSAGIVLWEFYAKLKNQSRL